MDLVCDIDGFAGIFHRKYHDGGVKSFVGDQAIVDVVDLDDGRLYE